MKRIALLANNYCMSGIVAAVKTYNIISLSGQIIYQFSLTFVSPLSPKNVMYHNLYLKTQQRNFFHTRVSPRRCVAVPSKVKKLLLLHFHNKYLILN